MTFFAKIFCRKRGNSISGSSPKYGVFTRDFDKVINANELDHVLGPLADEAKIELTRTWQLFETSLQSWKTEASLKGIAVSTQIREMLPDKVREDSVVSILVDQSGSMRGQSILLTAAAVDIAQDFLRHIGCKVEVLGFTSSSWKGGQSRKRWVENGRKPQRPGRLCDILHIIYRSADDMRKSSLSYALLPMLRPDVLKENVDGEAVEWAISRLAIRPESRKIVVVISDGAPVDDSTIAANEPNILVDHLRSTIENIEKTGVFELAAIGIGHDVGKYYSHSLEIEGVERIGISLITFLADILLSRRSGEP